MIATDFAANENLSDAWLSLKLLFQPWRWNYGKETILAKKKLLNNFSLSTSKLQLFFFLTGRAALNTILKSLDLTPGSEVIVQAFTCEAVILPILANKLMPVYADIERPSFSMDPIELEKKITPKAKVVILQHTFGIPPAQRDKIQTIVRKHNLVLIEDIAHGYSKQQISNSILLMSFGRSKALSSVFGGAVATNNKVLIKKITGLDDYLALPSMFFIFRLLLYKPVSVFIKSTYDIYIGRIIHKMINWSHLLIPEITSKEKSGKYDQILNKAYPNALAILLLQQLKHFDQVQRNRALVSAFYAKSLKKFSIFNFQFSVLPLLRYPVLIKNRDSVLKKAAKKNVFLGHWYDQVVAPKSLNLKKVYYQSGSCPVAERLCQKIINLPTNINHQQAESVIRTLDDVL